MTLDYDRYLAHLDEFDLPEPRKRELIGIVFGVMESFIDTAFGVHPVQTAMEIGARGISKSDETIVGLNHENLTEKYEQVASVRQKDQP